VDVEIDRERNEIPDNDVRKNRKKDDDGDIGESFEEAIDHPPTIVKV
jgi:hypothetical protein